MLVFLVFYHFCWERSWLSFCSFEIICLFLWLLRFSLSFHNFTIIFSWLGFILCEIYCISWIYGWISFNNLEKFKVIISSNIAYAPFSHFFTHTHTHTHVFCLIPLSSYALICILSLHALVYWLISFSSFQFTKSTSGCNRLLNSSTEFLICHHSFSVQDFLMDFL